MMEGEVVSGLVKQLVLRIFPSRSKSAEDGAGSHGEVVDDVVERAHKYAMRIIGSRIVPSLANDEAAMAESVKRQLVLEGRSSDALTFADLHRRFSSLSGAGSIENRWSVLYLLKAISEDQRREPSETRGIAGPLTSTISRPAALGGLAALPDSPVKARLSNGVSDSVYAPKRAQRSANLQKGYASEQESLAPGGMLLLSKDAENLKAAALREYVELNQEFSEVTEMALVRDVVYACQGIDGRYIKFDKEIDGYKVNDNLKLPKATKVLIRRLCEVGWLYRRVKEHITESLEQGPMEVIGTVGQAFCAALQEELSDYYRLMAVLEAQLHNPIPFMSTVEGAKGAGNYLSLRRLWVWLAEPLVRMRLMAVLVDDCKSLRGGAMAGAIHMHAQHGDPLVRGFMGSLLRRVCSPLFEMVRKWVLEGEIDDLYGEFFVVPQPVKAEALWREGYQLQTGMLPSFIPEPLAQRILRTGKSINFLRVCCEDQGWATAAADALAAAGTPAGGGGIGYGETETLEALVVEAAARIDRHLIRIIYDQYKFREHCLAIKRYLLLGQGDFIQYLMDLVGPDLSQPANTVSSFKLAGLLESAVRSSNAQYDDSDVLDRLRVRMMPHNEGDRGWDVFSLEYNARDPLTTIFTEFVMARYLRIFNFLWRLRCVDHALSATWQTMKPNCSIARLWASIDGGTKSQLAAVMRRCQTLRNEMNHFVTNLQYYIMFEVLEHSWANFLDEMEEAHDLDELIVAHERYLSSIVEKALLGERSQLLCKTLFTLFDLILRFRGLADRLYENAREVQTRGEIAARRKVKELQASVPYNTGFRKLPTVQLTKELLASMGEEMDVIAAEYSSLLEGFFAQLPVQQHVDLKFLSFRLDFSEFYTRQHMGTSTMHIKLKRTPKF
ncbi:hypothetical protein O6H91_08G072500 [Diphasiastrum complanatum]|uniref:Uncharacterized protein n=8 Tax=Diphasiastrum complanatum TaxID=34168 RepID=A0ACC2CYR3_DIPCM|nr:hypothetical protein O6H91_08G072500 [Diphasiastrum complanatum]KAJ7547159.1 hypothetical protein O6H91_08G072500 [Diphasiastrum complanatum]KAJ7547160.1 hypothetical protein O6H91_08G072500 [Diphasiastrum complanatum]KAJ7547161.1 hypothetical protein O6H91_08G072500 [Diphasiastrum complanatum]KAJ7547162.1 hypothetical protein O6H91_08G072500 [Diphasiastrum complanatum]